MEWIPEIISVGGPLLGVVVGAVGTHWSAVRLAKATERQSEVAADRRSVALLVHAMRSMTLAARDIASLFKQGLAALPNEPSRQGADGSLNLTESEARELQIIEEAIVHAFSEFQDAEKSFTLALPSVAACGDGRVSAYAFECQSAVHSLVDAKAELGTKLRSVSEPALAGVKSSRERLSECATVLLFMVSPDQANQRDDFRTEQAAREIMKL